MKGRGSKTSHPTSAPVAREGALARLQLRPPAERDALLVIAGEPTRSAALDLGREAGFETFTCATPLEARRILELRGDRIGYAILASDPPWAFDLRRTIAASHPEIEQIILVL